MLAEHVEQYTYVREQLMRVPQQSTKKGKLEVLAGFKHNEILKEALNFLLNSYVTVGLSTKKLTKAVDVVENDRSFVDTLSYLKDNPTGTNVVIGNLRYLLDELKQEPNGEELYRFYVAFFSKKLSLGISADTANAVFGDTFIPVFKVQLAYLYDKKIHMYDETDIFYVTQKLDGHRALTTVEPKNGKISITTRTRQGKEYTGLLELHKHIIQLIAENPDVMRQFANGFVLDGELLLRNINNLPTNELFQATSKVLASDGEKTNIEYNVFDMLPLDQFLYQKSSKNVYKHRRTDWLDKLTGNSDVKIIPILGTITKEEIPYWSQEATNRGWEGAMLNYANGRYEKTRSSGLLKVKTMHTADLEIVGFNQAIDGKYEGSLQSLNVRLDDDNIVQVGSGLSDEQRQEIWNNQDRYMGVMVEVQYFEETKNQNGGKSLRFPVFKGFRYDKTPEDTNIE